MKIKVATACFIAVAAHAQAHALEKTFDQGHDCPPFQPAVFIPEHAQNESATALDVGAWSPGMTFDFDKTMLTPYTIGVLKENVEILKKYPDLRIEVAGHTDSIGSNGYNQALSHRRAMAVYEHLVHHGVNPVMLKTSGYGKDRPIAPNTKEDGSDYPCGRVRNRRVELNVLN